DIAVHHTGRVHVVESTEDLVDEVLHMLVSEGVSGIENLVQVGFHVLHNQVQIEKLIGTNGPIDIQQSHDVSILPQVLHDLNLAQAACGQTNAGKHVLNL